MAKNITWKSVFESKLLKLNYSTIQTKEDPNNIEFQQEQHQEDHENMAPHDRPSEDQHLHDQGGEIKKRQSQLNFHYCQIILHLGVTIKA